MNVCPLLKNSLYDHLNITFVQFYWKLTPRLKMPPKKPVVKSTSTTKANTSSTTTATKKTSPSKSSSGKTSSSPTKKSVPAKKTSSSPTKKSVPAKKTETPAKTAPEIEKKEEISVTEVTLKDVAKILLNDEGGKLKESGRCPLVIDPTGNVATFLKYREVNFIEAVDPTQLQPEVLRMALLGAIRFGKALAIDMKDTDMFDTCTEKFDAIYKGLMDDIMSKEIIKNENFKRIVKDTDGEEYQKPHNFSDDMMDNFKLIIVTKIEPNAELMKKTYPFRVIP